MKRCGGASCCACVNAGSCMYVYGRVCTCECVWYMYTGVHVCSCAVCVNAFICVCVCVRVRACRLEEFVSRYISQVILPHR